jgi:hypothetical protein
MKMLLNSDAVSIKLLTQVSPRRYFFIASGVKLSPLYCGHFWPIVPPPDDRWGWLWSNWWNEDWQGKPKYSEKTRPSATLSTTNPTWSDPGSNPGRSGGKPTTNRLSYGATLSASLTSAYSLRFFRTFWLIEEDSSFVPAAYLIRLLNHLCFT